MPLSHYTVGYHDAEQHQLEICEYASNSYEAIEHAKEDVPYIGEHSRFIDRCTNETGLDWLRSQGSMI